MLKNPSQGGMGKDWLRVDFAKVLALALSPINHSPQDFTFLWGIRGATQVALMPGPDNNATNGRESSPLLTPLVAW
jgi:hypothetical protein